MENIIDDLNYRGLIKDYSNEKEIRELLFTPQTIYCGFDPSAASMHIGNFVMISLLMRFQRAGHRVIAVVGGATGMIGDPSGKSKERNLLTSKDVASNASSIKEQLSRFIDLDDEKKGILVNNYDWLSKISMLDFLREYGKYFPINYMLSKEIVSSRLDSGISFTEFSYQILQSVDFLTLYRKYNCTIQIGGSDQWGNLTSGLELIRKLQGNETKVGVMTAHLITNSEGKKFGKSEEGALFLNPLITSPYKLYQYFINSTDADAIKYIKVFTFLSHQEIDQLEKEHNANLGARIGQKALAYEVTKIIHGQDKADEAKLMSEALFQGNIKALSKDNLEELLGSLKFELNENTLLEDALIAIKAASSKREAREFINGGSISLNGDKVNDLTKVLTKKDALFNEYIVIRRGKKNYYLIKL